MAKAKVTKGKRYTTAEKQEVLDYVAKIDAEKGRGGVAAAAREFGITALSITAWKKKLGETFAPSKASKAAPDGAAKGSTAQARLLHRLGEILDEIECKKAAVAALEKEYAKLKKRI